MAEDSVRDPRSLLDAVKAQEKAMLNDEGFLSSHHVRGRGFPTERPHGVSDGALTDAVENQLVHRVKLHGETHVSGDTSRAEAAAEAGAASGGGGQDRLGGGET